MWLCLSACAVHGTRVLPGLVMLGAKLLNVPVLVLSVATVSHGLVAPAICSNRVSRAPLALGAKMTREVKNLDLADTLPMGRAVAPELPKGGETARIDHGDELCAPPCGQRAHGPSFVTSGELLGDFG